MKSITLFQEEYENNGYGSGYGYGCVYGHASGLGYEDGDGYGDGTTLTYSGTGDGGRLL